MGRGGRCVDLIIYDYFNVMKYKFIVYYYFIQTNGFFEIISTNCQHFEIYDICI